MPGPMKLSFMTLGCPAWDIDTICHRGREYGFEGVDFRGVGDQIDVTRLAAFTTDVQATARRLGDAGLAVSGLSSSLLVCDPSKRAQNIEEAQRTIDVAASLGTRNVRIFGGGTQGWTGPADRPTTAAIGCECINAILDLPGARSLSWNFETHDFWVKGADCRLLLDAIPDPAFGTVWDMGHTSRVGGETPEETFTFIGPRVRYAHVKDALCAAGADRSNDKSWHYVLPGTGELPLARAVGVLGRAGYDGWLTFEHEKRWHPELEDPEVAFPAFIRWARQTLGQTPG